MTVDLADLVHRGDGHDGAHYQMDAGPVDLSALHATPMEWLAWKCSQSIKYKDPTYTVIEPWAEREKFRWFLGYGWLSSTTDPNQQADNFLSYYGKKRPGKGAMIDAEEAGITVATTVAKAERIEAELKQPSVIYTGLYVAGGTIWRSEEVRNSAYGPRPMALAAYVTRDNLIARLTALGLLELAIDVWQWSSNGILPDGRHLPGIVGRADIDTILTPSMMDLACGVALTPTPTPIPLPPQEDDMPKFFDNAEVRTMPYGHAQPQTAVFISDIEKRNIGAEEYTAWGSPARASLSNAALDAIPDAGGGGTVDTVARAGLAQLNDAVGRVGQSVGGIQSGLIKAGGG